MKLFYIILMSLIISSTIFSQENSKKTNNYALSFGIAGNFRLGAFNGDIAVKKIIDNTHQLRLFLSPRIFTKNDETNSSNNNITVTNDNETRNYSIGVGADYLWTLITNEDITMFGGTGLVFTYGNNNFKVTSQSKFNANDNNKFINETNNPFTNIGIRGTLGVEWKVTDKIGIHSEYLFTGSYNWSKSEIKSSRNVIDNPTKTRTSSGISLGSGVLFGISIYF